MTAVDTPTTDHELEQVFTPHSRVMPPVLPYVADLWARRRFIMALANAEIRGPRSNTAAGQLWAVLDPLFQAAIYFFLVTVVRGSRGDQVPYLVTLIGCVFLFDYTRIALSDGGRSIIRSKGLMLNSNFPRALLPVTAVYKGLLRLVPTSFVFVVIFVLAGQPIGAGITLLPLLLVIHTAINVGLALSFATLTVYMRDMANLLGYILRILMFTTPVIYPASALTPGLRSVLVINPLFALFSAYQEIINGRTPAPGLILQSAVWAAVTLVIGVRVFLSHERAFALRL
jgi:teichoic acid transport system permease protein